MVTMYMTYTGHRGTNGKRDKRTIATTVFNGFENLIFVSLHTYTDHSIMVHLVYIRPCGVPDKLCVFPADES